MSTGIEIDNPNHHPALRTEDYAPSSLTLVLPGDPGARTGQDRVAPYARCRARGQAEQRARWHRPT
jgi:hypothetical protein